MRVRRLVLRAITSFVMILPLCAEVEGITVTTREAFFLGAAVPGRGPYERLVGTLEFAFDPTQERNAAIVDLDRAPRDSDGKVRAKGDFVVLQALDPAQRRGTGFLEVVNRGTFASLRYFNGSPTLDPRVDGDNGDVWLLRQGLTLIWVGWQFDVPEGENRLRLSVPPVDTQELGLVRSDWVLDAPRDTLPLAHRDHIAYPVADRTDTANELTVRDGRMDERRVVPRQTWSFARLVDGEVVSDRTHIHAPGGFQSGRIYELVYRATNPVVGGLGLAAVRDAMSYAKYDDDCPFSVELGLAFGVSQTGRFLRHFLHEGFNVDEAGRRVFDGVLIHTAGAGRGSFNHRFAQPSRDGHRYSAFSYPTDLFPFSGRTQRDAILGRSDGLLAAPQQADHLPRVIYTNTGYEYWGRGASLLHTSLDASADVEPLPDERIYHLTSGQHFVAAYPPTEDTRLSLGEGVRAWRGNPLDFRVSLRAILFALMQWVEDDVPPPPSAFPRIDEDQLVPVHRLAFPQVPGMSPPRVVHEVRRRNYGERWDEGIIDVQPPVLGPAYGVLVPQVDRLGNEVGGWPMLELLVPVATYTPWSLRTDYASATDELVDFRGNYVPLPLTEEERARTGDERPSLQALYPDESAYLEQLELLARRLADGRYLLEEDIQRVVRRAGQHWRFVHGL